MRLSPPEKGGAEALRADTICGYISTIRRFTSVGFGCDILVAECQLRAREHAKAMRWDDGPAADRGLRRPIRGEHLEQQAANEAFDKTSSYGKLRWAVVTLAYNLLLRGGDVGRPSSGKPWSVKHGIAWKHVKAVWKLVEPLERSTLSEATLRELQELVAVLVKPCKDTDARKKRYPMLMSWKVAMRALQQWYECCLQWASPAELESRAVFELPGGVRVVSTKDVATMFKEVAAACHIDTSDVGGAAGRIGGAIDVRCVVGPEELKRLLAERGRWDSDIGFVYSRPDAMRHLWLSESMSGARRLDIESLVNGLKITEEAFAQPADMRAR